MAGSAGRGAHGRDAVVDVECEAVHHHVVELDAPADTHMCHALFVLCIISSVTAAALSPVSCTALISWSPLQDMTCGT